MDKNFITELKALDDQKEAKRKLIEYALSFNIQVKKSRSFDNIVSDIEEQLAVLSSTPMPEQNEGLLIADLIQAADEAEGKAMFLEASDEAKELLIDEPIAETPTIVFEVPQPEYVPVKVEVIKDIEPVEIIEVAEEPVEEVIIKPEIEIVREDSVFELPENFSPTIVLMGKGPAGYYTCPFWIYEWIRDNADWKSKPLAFPKPSVHNTLLSLLYFIKRDGKVIIRETRNSSFVTLS